MRIAIDGSAASVGGSATYMYNLLPALARIDRENEYMIFCTQDQFNWNFELPENFKYVYIPLRHDQAAKRIHWMQTKLPMLIKQYKIDVVYSPNDQTPFFVPCPAVLAIRNFCPYSDQNVSEGLKDKLRLLLLRRLTHISSRKASKVIFVSNLSKRIISQRIGIPEEKGVTIYHGRSENFNTETAVGPEFQSYKPYILSVSTIYRYKNYVTLIRAFAKLIKEYGFSHNLLIAGRPVHTDYFDEMKKVIADENIGTYVHLLGEVDYPRVPGLYAGSSLFVFPSCLETFGHPLIEAMASGVPVVTSNTSVMPEICGDSALYFDTFNHNELAEVMKRVLADSVLWEKMSRSGIERAKDFSWAKTAKMTLEVLKSIKTESKP